MRYYELIGLKREPFSMTPDPEFFFESKAHGEILNRLEIALRLNRGLSVIMGGIGTGKTTLSRLLLSRFIDFGKDFQFYLIMDPTWENTREFLVYLKRLFGLRGSSLYQSEMLNQLENFLIDTAIKKGKQIVLIIDEGQKMGTEQIEVIRTLLNFETNSRKLIQVVIFAQPEFKEVVSAHENFRDRIAFGATIPALDREDTIAFVDFRINEAGYEGKEPLFSQEAKEMIYQHTGGYPRKIVNMCHHLIVDMLVYNKKVVDGGAVLNRINSNDNNYAG